jgi:DNA-binding transcriptional LysR family regulator
MGSNETIKQAVMAGLGLSLISAHTIVSEVAAARLAILKVEGLPIVRQWFVVRRSDRELSPAGGLCGRLSQERGVRFYRSLVPSR